MPTYFYLIFALLFALIVFIGQRASSSNKKEEPKPKLQERLDIELYLEENYSKIITSFGLDDVDNILSASFDQVLTDEPMHMFSKKLYPDLKQVSFEELDNAKAKILLSLLDVSSHEHTLYQLDKFYFSRNAFIIPISYGQYADSTVYVKCPYDDFKKGEVSWAENSIGGNIIVEFRDLAKFEASERVPSKAFKQGFPLSSETNKIVFKILGDFVDMPLQQLKVHYKNVRSKIHNEYKADLEQEIQALNKIWQDESGNLKIAPNAYAHLFEDNKSSINADHTDKISDLIKVKSFIQENATIITDTLKLLLESKGLNEIIRFNKSLIKSAQFHEYLVAVGVEFLLSLLENDQIRYHEIREMFDRNNVFENTWQKEMKKQMSRVNINLTEISEQIGGLRDDIERFEDTMISEMTTLQLVSAQGFAALGSKLNQLNSSVETVGNKIDVGNTIAAVNTYQNMQTRKALSS